LTPYLHYRGPSPGVSEWCGTNSVRTCRTCSFHSGLQLMSRRADAFVDPFN
jgi:hypothetical protein